MQNIDIKELKEIKEELNELGDEDVLFVNERNETKYVLLPIKLYDKLDSYRNMLFGDKTPEGVKIISNTSSDLTYDEYETIKKQLIDVFDKTFRPKPDKLN